jgi:transposase
MRKPVEIDSEEDGPVIARAAAIDVAKASGMVCTRVPHASKPGRKVTKVWEVDAATDAIVELAGYLAALGIERVVLEATGDYWRCWYYLLSAAGLECWLVNARDVKNAPGRPKTDKLDAVWLCKLNEKNMVRRSFVPAEPMRQVRDWTRDRFDLVADRTRVRQRVEKLLEDALLKMSVVITDIFGVSGRAIMAALIGGQRDPAKLVALAVPRIIKNKRAALTQALTGRFTGHHAARLEMLLAQHDQLTALIDQVTAQIDQAITALPPAPASDSTSGPGTPAGDPSGPGTAAASDAYLSAVQRLCEIPGIGPEIARSIIGEIGLDVTGVFGTAQRLCSWAKVSPRTVQSGATKRSGKTGKGNFYLKSGLGQAATGAAKTGTFLGERYRRLVKRMPKAKAKTAIARSILVIVFELLADPTKRFQDLGPGHYAKRMDTGRRTTKLTDELRALGWSVTLTPLAA